MNRSRERVAQKWDLEVPERKSSSSTEESSSFTASIENSPYVKNSSTPLRSKWNAKQINRSPRNARDTAESEDTEEESFDEVEPKRFQTRKELSQDDRGKHQETSERKRGIRGQKARHDRRERRESNRRAEEFGSEKRKDTSVSQTSGKRHERGDATRFKKRNRDSKEEEDELPITEILKRSQENARVKYEHQPPLPELSTDKIYVQHRGGFSAMKINRLRQSGKGRKAEANKNKVLENQGSPPVKIAIAIQKLWKSTGLVFQGILGGMALMHSIMLHVFFNVSVQFIADHSIFCEIYTSMFSFLITLCIVSTFDRFDLARFNVEHLREIYLDYSKSIIAVPLYLTIFCLHQVCLNTDHQLALVHYYNLNDSLWENVTKVQTLLDDLNSWQKISMSKDLLAVLSWLFVSLGTKDDAFLIHLQSIEKYTNDIDSSRQ